MEAYHVFQRNGKETIGKTIPQIMFGGKGDFFKIIETADIIAAFDPCSGKPFFIERGTEAVVQCLLKPA
jgi:hypothetical protein